jgi:hypothetical protein
MQLALHSLYAFKHFLFLPCKQDPIEGSVLQMVETEQGLNS